jgi:hypothetical protein
MKPIDGCSCGECREAWRVLLSHQRRQAEAEEPLRDEYRRLLNKLDQQPAREAGER